MKAGQRTTPKKRCLLSRDALRRVRISIARQTISKSKRPSAVLRANTNNKCPVLDPPVMPV